MPPTEQAPTNGENTQDPFIPSYDIPKFMEEGGFATLEQAIDFLLGQNEQLNETVQELQRQSTPGTADILAVANTKLDRIMVYVNDPSFTDETKLEQIKKIVDGE